MRRLSQAIRRFLPISPRIPYPGFRIPVSYPGFVSRFCIRVFVSRFCIRVFKMPKFEIVNLVTSYVFMRLRATAGLFDAIVKSGTLLDFIHSYVRHRYLLLVNSHDFAIAQLRVTELRTRTVAIAPSRKTPRCRYRSTGKRRRYRSARIGVLRKQGSLPTPR